MDTTTVLPPGDRLTQDGDGNLLIEISGAERAGYTISA
jgi:hypothetical protein